MRGFMGLSRVYKGLTGFVGLIGLRNEGEQSQA